MDENKKVLIIDTNVLINDPFAIYHFLQENDVCVPPVVLTELDSLKGRKSSAQDAIRLLENITAESNGDLYYGNGISVKYDNKTLTGKFYIKTFKFHSELKKRSLSASINDDLIINTAYCFKKRGRRVELITEDLNVRLKARALGIKSEVVKYLSAPKETLGYLGYRFVSDNVHFMKNEVYISDNNIINKYKPKVNEYFVIDNNIFYRFDGEKFILGRRSEGVFGIKPKNIEQIVLIDALMSKDIKLITVSGIAGTGKTLLSLAVALTLKFKNIYDEILVSRREIGVNNDSQGFLPGSEQDKIKPFMMPFIDNLNTIINVQKGNIKKIEKISGDESYPFTIFSTIYIRGRSIQKSFIIIDEAQNLTPHQIKTVITRAGEGTKIVLLGDISQVDTQKYLRSDMNGLTYVMSNLKGKKLFASFRLKKVERSELAKLGTLLP